MLLSNKVAVVYGGGGRIGGAVARAFARDGARVFLAGRTLAKVQAVADEIVAAGGVAEAAAVDALDKAAIEQHLAELVNRAGAIDVSFNAISIRGDLQGTPLLEMTQENFATPATIAINTHFLTATAAARHMVKRGSGVILTMSATSAGLSGRDHVFHSIGGFGVACTAVEALSRTLAGQVGRQGARVICLRSDAIPETWGPDVDAQRGTRTFMTEGSILGRMPTLREVADAAVFAASDRASAMSGTIMNLSCGSILDNN